LGEIGFHSKRELAADVIKTALDGGVGADFATGDEAPPGHRESTPLPATARSCRASIGLTSATLANVALTST
jgi:hypothetical protein